MKGEIIVMASEYYHRQMDKYSEFVPIQHLAEQFGLETAQLMERLEKGCSLPVALLVPHDLEIQTVKHYPKRETHYTICQQVFRGPERELLRKLRMDSRRRQLDGDSN